MTNDERLHLLKEVLLQEEHKLSADLSKRLNKLETSFDSEEEVAHRIRPILNKHLDEFTKTTLSALIVKGLRKEIENSQEAVVEALYPIIGKMIKKYIASEINLLNEKINNQINKALSFKNLFNSIFRRNSISDQIIIEATKPILLEIFVIEKESGILIANYKREGHSSMDEEMVAGMLTAIKSFVEDAFQKESQNLETITYDLYTLHIQNFFNFYITSVISGPYNLTTKNILENKILDFAQNGISREDLEKSEIFNQKLKDYFINETL